MKKIIYALLLISSSTVMAQPNNLTDDELKDLIRKKFILSSYDKYYPKQYGAYLIPKDEAKKGICVNKKNKGSLFLMDHEGGEVRRIPSDTVSARKGADMMMEIYKGMWKKDLGWMQLNCIDATLGPAVDIGFASRSYSESWQKNFSIVTDLVKVYDKSKITYAIKHFPGEYLDCSRVNPDKEQHKCKEDLQQINKDWGSYLKNKKPPALMVSHNYYRTKEDKPAFMNREILEYLRNDIKYQGVLITDALWELDKKMEVKDLVYMFRYTDLIMTLDYKVTEESVNILAKMAKEYPILIEYALESQERIKKWRK